MYSALRKKLSEPRITHPSYFVGLLLRNCSLPHANFGHVVLAKPSPILFYPISSTEVRWHREDHRSCKCPSAWYLRSGRSNLNAAKPVAACFTAESSRCAGA
jgi:Squalene epoxidase